MRYASRKTCWSFARLLLCLTLVITFGHDEETCAFFANFRYKVSQKTLLLSRHRLLEIFVFLPSSFKDLVWLFLGTAEGNVDGLVTIYRLNASKYFCLILRLEGALHWLLWSFEGPVNGRYSGCWLSVLMPTSHGRRTVKVKFRKEDREE